MSEKLSILVRVDLDHAKAQVLAKGHVTIHSIQALYVVVKRANALKHNLDLELDVRDARVEACSETHHLPARIDPQQTHCTLSILAPRRVTAKATEFSHVAA